MKHINAIFPHTRIRYYSTFHNTEIHAFLAGPTDLTPVGRSQIQFELEDPDKVWVKDTLSRIHAGWIYKHTITYIDNPIANLLYFDEK